MKTKTEKEFNLSERIINQKPFNWQKGYPIFHPAILKEDVKEFIKRLKATMLITPSPTERGKFILWLGKEIEKLAGSRLVEDEKSK